MGWARLDDGFHDHPKLIGLPLEAVGLYTLALTWAHRHKGASSGLLGHIPADLPTRLAGSKGKSLAARLETHQLWDVEAGLGGWVIHDFSDYLPAADRPTTAAEVRAARSEAGRRGARARWNGNAETTTQQADGKLLLAVDGKAMPPTRPDPDQDHRAAGAARDFEEFWALYPRKVGKQKARAKFVVNAKRVGARAIIDGLKAQLPTLTASDPQFIPHPTTWLERGSWDDEAGPERRERGWWE